MSQRTGKRRPLPVASLERLEARKLLSDVIAVGPEFRVNTGTYEGVRSVAMDADGDFVVAWQRFLPDGTYDDVYARRYNASGVAQGNEFRVNTYTTDEQADPAVAMDADGDFVVAWTSARQEGSGDGVYAQRYNAAGVAQGGEFNVNTFTTGTQRFPAVAMDAAGDFVVTWHSYTQDGSGSGVYAQRYNSAGVPQGGEFRVNTYTTSTQRLPTVAMDADGDFVVAWESYGQDGSIYGIHAQRFSADGSPQGLEFRVNTYTLDHQSRPRVAMDAVGDFVVVWTSWAQDGSLAGVYAQRYNSVGLPQGGEFRVNTYTTSHQAVPTVAIDSAGDFVVAWQSDGQDSGTIGVYAQRFNASGMPQGGEFRVNTYTTGNQGNPRAAMDADGDFVIAWQGPGAGVSGTHIFAQRYAVVPEVAASAFHFATAPHKLSFTFDRDVSASLGTDDLVVQNLTTMQTIPSSDFSSSYDTLTNVATFTYTGTTAGIVGTLPDGNYTATLIASGITTIQGAPLAANHIFEFHFLQGDANNDGRVNLQDFNILAANFGQSPRDFTQGDFNYDMIVNLNDFNILAARFGHVLAAPPARSGGSVFGEMFMSHTQEGPLEELI